jgi:hypothetical protein
MSTADNHKSVNLGALGIRTTVSSAKEGKVVLLQSLGIFARFKTNRKVFKVQNRIKKCFKSHIVVDPTRTNIQLRK